MLVEYIWIQVDDGVHVDGSGAKVHIDNFNLFVLLVDFYRSFVVVCYEEEKREEQKDGLNIFASQSKHMLYALLNFCRAANGAFACLWRPHMREHPKSDSLQMPLFSLYAVARKNIYFLWTHSAFVVNIIRCMLNVGEGLMIAYKCRIIRSNNKKGDNIILCRVKNLELNSGLNVPRDIIQPGI